ncbi:RING-H2 finger protein [Quillaja saponaria]|uniref:RING-H2 finger protein n=1 Tax=Quillaja saponaria TaxID=32244 RepID=A0AAD7Q1D3_QUISA|nr:RING-H2 finger protein [Quillaja saponaria]
METTDSRSNYALNGKIMLCSTIILFVSVFIIILFHRYVRRYCSRRRQIGHFFSDNRVIPSNIDKTGGTGLDPFILKSLPPFTCYFSSTTTTHLPLQNCAICLSDFEDGHRARFLPNCNHVFHTHCIGTWFRSHSNCPLCRDPVHPVHGLGQPNVAPSSQIKTSGSVNELGRTEEGQVGCSSLPPLMESRRTPLELMGMYNSRRAGLDRRWFECETSG